MEKEEGMGNYNKLLGDACKEEMEELWQIHAIKQAAGIMADRILEGEEWKDLEEMFRKEVEACVNFQAKEM